MHAYVFVMSYSSSKLFLVTEYIFYVHRYMQRRLRLKTIEHLAEQFSAHGMREEENVKIKQAYDEDAKQQMKESEIREREMQHKLHEAKELQEKEQRRREEEIKQVKFDLCD